MPVFVKGSFSVYIAHYLECFVMIPVDLSRKICNLGHLGKYAYDANPPPPHTHHLSLAYQTSSLDYKTVPSAIFRRASKIQKVFFIIR